MKFICMLHRYIEIKKKLNLEIPLQKDCPLVHNSLNPQVQLSTHFLVLQTVATLQDSGIKKMFMINESLENLLLKKVPYPTVQSFGNHFTL